MQESIKKFEKELVQKREEHRKEINKMMYDFIMSNRKYEKGDIITDTRSDIRIKVSKITPSSFHGQYMVVYEGVIVTKKMEEHKTGKTGCITEYLGTGVTTKLLLHADGRTPDDGRSSYVQEIEII